MPEFVSESITPRSGTFGVEAMSRGEPGLPTGFSWRDADYAVVEVLDAWKESGPEKGRAQGDRYLRRHCYRLRMSDASTWTVYFLRTTPTGGRTNAARRTRWFLLTREA